MVNLNEDLIPSAHLIEKCGIGEGDFEALGSGMINRFIGRGYLNHKSRILDIGCGLGRLARPLTKYLDEGKYYGMDINKDSINWCQTHYASHKNFHFEWMDLYSKFYNPTAVRKASAYKFPLEDNSFDFVMLSSVFTHMILNDVDNYLQEIARLLKPGGRCYITYFLLTPELHASFAIQGKYFPIKGGFVDDKDVPEKVVFLREDMIRELYAKHNLEIEKIIYGIWPGRQIASGYQDEIIAKGTEYPNGELAKLRNRLTWRLRIGNYIIRQSCKYFFQKIKLLAP